MTFFTVLTLIFIVLKLTHYIDWSWWFVIMPTIIHGMLFVLLMGIVASDNKRNRWRQ